MTIRFGDAQANARRAVRSGLANRPGQGNVARRQRAAFDSFLNDRKMYEKKIRREDVNCVAG